MPPIIRFDIASTFDVVVVVGLLLLVVVVVAVVVGVDSCTSEVDFVVEGGLLSDVVEDLFGFCLEKVIWKRISIMV